jgi:hypothetical protein
MKPNSAHNIGSHPFGGGASMTTTALRKDSPLTGIAAGAANATTAITLITNKTKLFFMPPILRPLPPLIKSRYYHAAYGD